jgi:hypothetical protein
LTVATTQDDDGPLCHFEVDEYSEIHQRVDPALAYYEPPNPEVYLTFDGSQHVEVWEHVKGQLRRSTPVQVQYEATTPEPPSGISSHWTDPNVKLTPVPLWEWIESLPDPAPFKLTDWQRQLLELTYAALVAQNEHTRKTWRHLRLVKSRPEEPTRTEWEHQLDAVRADHDEQQHRRLWSNQDLGVTTREC